MVVQPIHGPACQGTDVVKHGKTSDGKPRFRCQHEPCTRVTCLRESVYQGRIPAVKRHMIASAILTVWLCNGCLSSSHS